MKKVIVFGAAGRTGKYLVEYALNAGYAVTAFVHHNKADIAHADLTVVEGDIYDKEKVVAAIKGHDIIISAVGTNQIAGDAVNVMSDAIKVFVEAMNQFGIKRVLAIGGRAVLQVSESTQQIDLPDYPALYKNVGEGHNKVYKVLRDTDLDWTFMGCPNIVDGPKTGHYAVKKDYLPEGTGQIFTGDLADFIVKEMDANNFIKTRVAINNV